jgi:AmiR/NasT family two-component response regulator
VGPLQVGAVDLYSNRPLRLDAVQERRASELADVAARTVLQRALESAVGDADDDLAEDDNPYSRKIIHQATGMVLAQLGIGPDDARMVIQAHAFASNRSMMSVAQEILDRRLDFSDPDLGSGSGSGQR